MLDSDHMPLQHFFIVLEHVLRHGLRPKKVRFNTPVTFNFNENILGFVRTEKRVMGYITNGRKICT